VGFRDCTDPVAPAQAEAASSAGSAFISSCGACIQGMLSG
jgi:hypothetical protein